MIFKTAEEAYHGVLREVLLKGVDDGEGNLEIINLAFEISDPEVVEFRNKVRNFKKQFAQQFFDFIMAGGTDASSLFSVNANAQKFTDDLASRNTAYGPRILAQMPGVIEELKARPSSRRAVITILSSDDQVLLPEKQRGSGMEYPCTVSLIFLIRDGQLNLHVAMRSNNMTTTVCYDLYNFIGVQKILLARLREEGVEVRLGRYYHVCASGHILQNEIDLARQIVKEEVRDSCRDFVWSVSLDNEDYFIYEPATQDFLSFIEGRENHPMRRLVFAFQKTLGRKLRELYPRATGISTVFGEAHYVRDNKEQSNG